MRLSDFHIQLAKEFALGKKNSELLSSYTISPSRLSVIKANPLFKREIERQRQVLEDKYNQAIKILEAAAEDVAREMVKWVKDPLVSAETRYKVAESVLDRIAAHSGQLSGGQHSNELVFEQLLRVTKRGMGETNSDDEADESFDHEVAYKDLMHDLAPVDEAQVVNVLPEPPSFMRQAKQVLESDSIMPTTGDNGGAKNAKLSTRLSQLLNQGKTN